MTKAEEEKLFKDNISRYYFYKARSAERELRFVAAIEFYQLAYQNAAKDSLVTAMRYKWDKERCQEMKTIHEQLLDKVHPISKVGLVDGNDIWVYWMEANRVIPTEILRPAERIVQDKVNYLYQFPILRYNTISGDVEFFKVKDVLTESEPRLLESITVCRGGVMIHHPVQIDPPILFNKWATYSNSNVMRRETDMRRAIKIEFLKMPLKIRDKAQRSSKFFAAFVEPYIGNRNLNKAIKHLVY